jgi:hypothetical protein
LIGIGLILIGYGKQVIALDLTMEKLLFAFHSWLISLTNMIEKFRQNVSYNNLMRFTRNGSESVQVKQSALMAEIHQKEVHKWL